MTRRQKRRMKQLMTDRRRVADPGEWIGIAFAIFWVLFFILYTPVYV